MNPVSPKEAPSSTYALLASDLEIVKQESAKASRAGWTKGISREDLTADLSQSAIIIALESRLSGDELRWKLRRDLEELVAHESEYTHNEGERFTDRTDDDEDRLPEKEAGVARFTKMIMANYARESHSAREASIIRPAKVLRTRRVPSSGEEFRTEQQLLADGWTRASIKKYLDPPDRMRESLRNISRPVKFYDLVRVIAAQEKYGDHGQAPRLRKPRRA